MSSRLALHRTFMLLPLALAVQAASAGMVALEESELSAVAGQDGLSAVLGNTTIAADEVRLEFDNPNATYPGYNAYLSLDDVTLTGVNADGSTTNLPYSLTAALDVGANAGQAGISLALNWTRQRLRIDALRHELAPTKSYGATAFDTSGQVTMTTWGGLLNTASNNASFRAIVNNGQWFYRQNGNEFVWQNFDMNFGFDAGTFGVDEQGIFLAASRFDFEFLWDIGYRASPAQAFTTSADTVPYLRYGWLGGVKDVQARVRPGGFWVGGTESNRTQGINISWWADADTDFEWVIGDSVGTPAPTVLYFQDWVNMPGASSSINVPNLTLDVIRAAGQGPGTFLYNGSPVDVPADAPGIGLAIRDLHFLSYMRKIRVLDPSIGMDKVFNWSLIYTLGDLDLNLIAYPGGKASVNPNEGIRFDLALGVQSPSTWQGNTHFMIGDSDPAVNTGLGFLNTEFLITIDNGYVTLLPTGLEIETTTDFRWVLYGQFGGGRLNDLSNPVRALDLELDLHASAINAKFIPPTLPATYIGFQWDARLYQSNAADPSTADSKIVISEPSRPDVTLTLGKIGGDIQARNGKIDLRAGAESSDNYPRLAFEQDLRFGLSATNPSFFSGGNRPFIVNDFKIGNASIGSLAIPGGNWYGALALKEQL